jgi:hypothetical protein
MAMEMIEEVEVKNPRKKKLASLKKVETMDTELRKNVPVKEVQKEDRDFARLTIVGTANTIDEMRQQQREKEEKDRLDRAKSDKIIHTFSPMKSMKKK